VPLVILMSIELFVEASDGHLQAYIDCHNDTICLRLRLKWHFTSSRSHLLYLPKGVIYSDLRLENSLVHTDSTATLNLFLCGFGWSTSGTIDGGHLPDSSFLAPTNRGPPQRLQIYLALDQSFIPL